MIIVYIFQNCPDTIINMDKITHFHLDNYSILFEATTGTTIELKFSYVSIACIAMRDIYDALAKGSTHLSLSY